MSSNCAIIKVMYYWLSFFVYYGQLDIDRLCLIHVSFRSILSTKNLAKLYLLLILSTTIQHIDIKFDAIIHQDYNICRNICSNKNFHCDYHYALCYPRYASFFQIKRVPNQMIYDRMLYAYNMKYCLNLWPSLALLHRKMNKSSVMMLTWIDTKGWAVATQSDVYF